MTVLLVAGSYSSPPLSLADGLCTSVVVSGYTFACLVCDGCVLYMGAENDVFDARWTYSTYTWDMWRLKPRSLDWF